ncbi:MAG: ribosomal protection-like ABC-F family protein [Deltaproteobacteria bacterium]
MLILEALNLKKYYGEKLIISVENLKIYKGDKIGIVGQNGAGKTTLLNLLAEEVAADEGSVKRYCDIAYIKQFSYESINADAKILKELNVQDKIKCDVLSGGESTRLKIADAVSKNCILMFADEPTSNLDYKGIEILKQKLNQSESLVLISHDRDLLNALCNKIIEVNDGKLSFYEGNFLSYHEQKRLQTEREWFEYEEYTAVRTRLEDAVRDRQGRSKSMKKAPKRMGNSEARLHKRKAHEKQEKIDNAAGSMKTRLEKLDIKQKPREIPEIKLDFSLTNPPENKIIISSDNLSFSYGSNKIFDNTSFKVYNGRKTAVVGDNGTGKTTLLNLINNRNNQIYVVPKAVLGYFYQGFENLNHSKTVLENVMLNSIQTESTARTILARLLISGDNVHKKVNVLSGGEKIKVSFAKLFVSNANVLLLDEPTNYLDMMSLEALENILCEYKGTVLFVSHDTAFVNKVADRLLVLKDRKIEDFEGNLKAFYEFKQKVKASDDKEMQKAVLEMKLTEIISRMSLPDCNKEQLKAEYSRLLEQLKDCK